MPIWLTRAADNSKSLARRVITVRVEAEAEEEEAVQVAVMTDGD